MFFFSSPCPDDSTDVGEEDSFLGQMSGNGPAASSTFSYFSSPATTSDPFASIGRSSYAPPSLSAAQTTTGPVSVPNSVSVAPSSAASRMTPPPQVFGSTVYQTTPSNPVGCHTPPPATMTPPPPQMPQQGHNPYRHTPASSRASPYIPAPEMLPPTHTPPQVPYSFSPSPQMFPPSGPAFTKVGEASSSPHLKIFMM